MDDENILHNSRVRHYRKSAHPRLRWTPELHEQFVDVVHSLGGKYEATPKRIVQMMGVNWLKISHIKSHLQMYRSMKEGSPWNHVQLPPKKQVNRERRRNNVGITYENDGYQVQSAQGTTSSAVTESDNRGETKMEVQDMKLGSNTYDQSYECSKHTYINLDLTM